MFPWKKIPIRKQDYIPNFQLTPWKNSLTAVCLQVAHLDFPTV